jgi:hypothetical protein
VEYEIKNKLTGPVVLYDCPRCACSLKSNLKNAGKMDECAECGMRFIVPGEAEVKAEKEEAERREIERRETERQEAEHWEAVRQATEKREAERREAEWQEAEHWEAVKQEVEKREADAASKVEESPLPPVPPQTPTSEGQPSGFAAALPSLLWGGGTVVVLVLLVWFVAAMIGTPF